MSLFKRLFKKSETKPPGSTQSIADPSPALPRISTRVAVKPLHHIFLTLNQNTTQIELLNISVTGIAALHTQLVSWPEPGQTVSARLHINDEVFLIQLNIVHFTHGLVGCCFVNPDPSFQKGLKKYFFLELSALAMTRVKPEVIQKTDEGTAHWYLGESSGELFFVENVERKIIRFHLSFLGNFFENDGKTLRYGQITAGTRDIKPGMKGSDLVRWESTIPETIIPFVHKFLDYIPALETHYKSQIEAMIQPK